MLFEWKCLRTAVFKYLEQKRLEMQGSYLNIYKYHSKEQTKKTVSWGLIPYKKVQINIKEQRSFSLKTHCFVYF